VWNLVPGERRKWMEDRLEVIGWLHRQSARRIGIRTSVGEDIALRLINDRQDSFNGNADVYYFPLDLPKHSIKLLKDYVERNGMNVVWVPKYDPKFLPEGVPEGERRALLKRSNLWGRLCEDANGNVDILPEYAPKGVLEEIIDSGKTIVLAADYELDFSMDDVSNLNNDQTALYLFVNEAIRQKKLGSKARYVIVPRTPEAWTGKTLDSLANWIAAGALDETWVVFENGAPTGMGEFNRTDMSFVDPKGKRM